MRIWSQNFVSIQPRTSLEKSDVSWHTMSSPLEALKLQRGALAPAARQEAAPDAQREIAYAAMNCEGLDLGCFDAPDSDK